MRPRRERLFFNSDMPIKFLLTSESLKLKVLTLPAQNAIDWSCMGKGVRSTGLPHLVFKQYHNYKKPLFLNKNLCSANSSIPSFLSTF